MIFRNINKYILVFILSILFSPYHGHCQFGGLMKKAKKKFSKVEPKYEASGDIYLSYDPIDPENMDQSNLITDKIELDKDNFSLYAMIKLPDGLTFNDVVDEDHDFAYFLSLNKRYIKDGDSPCLNQTNLVIPKDKLNANAHSFAIIPRVDDEAYWSKVKKLTFNTDCAGCFLREAEKKKKVESVAQLVFYSNAQPKNKDAQFMTKVLELKLERKEELVEAYQLFLDQREKAAYKNSTLPKPGRLNGKLSDQEKETLVYHLEEKGYEVIKYVITSDEKSLFKDVDYPYDPEFMQMRGWASCKKKSNGECHLVGFFIRNNYLGGGKYGEPVYRDWSDDLMPCENTEIIDEKKIFLK